jgi:uroporphyrinogen III methyltransferase/synthase
VSLGRVYLIGSGPGEADLLTERARACIGQADLLVYTGQALQPLLALARPEADQMQVDGPADALLVEAARSGRTVCRLIAGHPLRDGPGAVEARTLAVQGVPFEVVPGLPLAVGGVATAAEVLRWLEVRPLFGQRILVTRAPHQAGPLVDQIEALGGEACSLPVITMADPASWAPLDAALAQIERYAWLVITSLNGAAQFGARLMAAGKDARALAHLKIAAVGSGTAGALRAIGLQPDLVPEAFQGASLPAALAPHLAPGEWVLMVRGDLADPATADQLRQMGCHVDDLTAYRTLPTQFDPAQLTELLRQGAVQYATFTSGSTVVNLLQRLGGPSALNGVRIAVLGPQTKAAAEAAGLTVHVLAEQVSVAGLVNAIVNDVTQCR